MPVQDRRPPQDRHPRSGEVRQERCLSKIAQDRCPPQGTMPRNDACPRLPTRSHEIACPRSPPSQERCLSKIAQDRRRPDIATPPRAGDNSSPCPKSPNGAELCLSKISSRSTQTVPVQDQLRSAPKICPPRSARRSAHQRPGSPRTDSITPARSTDQQPRGGLPGEELRRRCQSPSDRAGISYESCGRERITDRHRQLPGGSRTDRGQASKTLTPPSRGSLRRRIAQADRGQASKTLTPPSRGSLGRTADRHRKLPRHPRVAAFAHHEATPSPRRWTRPCRRSSGTHEEDRRWSRMIVASPRRRGDGQSQTRLQPPTPRSTSGCFS